MLPNAPGVFFVLVLLYSELDDELAEIVVLLS
jgi:hypothetical protein